HFLWDFARCDALHIVIAKCRFDQVGHRAARSEPERDFVHEGPAHHSHHRHARHDRWRRDAPMQWPIRFRKRSIRNRAAALRTSIRAFGGHEDIIPRMTAIYFTASIFKLIGQSLPYKGNGRPAQSSNEKYSALRGSH